MYLFIWRLLSYFITVWFIWDSVVFSYSIGLSSMPRRDYVRTYISWSGDGLYNQWICIHNRGLWPLTHPPATSAISPNMNRAGEIKAPNTFALPLQIRMVLGSGTAMVRPARRIQYAVRCGRHSVYGHHIQWLVHVDRDWQPEFMRHKSPQYAGGKLE